MDDRHAQFLIAVGVPASIRQTTGEDQVDDSGYARTFRINNRVVNLDEILSCTLRSPALDL